MVGGLAASAVPVIVLLKVFGSDDAVRSRILPVHVVGVQSSENHKKWRRLRDFS